MCDRLRIKNTLGMMDRILHWIEIIKIIRVEIDQNLRFQKA